MLWHAASLVCTQDRLFCDALSAIDVVGDSALRLLLSSQSHDNCGVTDSSLISLLVKLHSNSLAGSLPSLLSSACAAASKADHDARSTSTRISSNSEPVSPKEGGGKKEEGGRGGGGRKK